MDDVQHDPDRPGTASTPLSQSVSAELSQFDGAARSSKAPRITQGAALARVLVVDDDADMRTYVTDCLSDVFDVVSTASLERAVTIARWMQPDVIVCDLVLPGHSGLELESALASEPGLASVPILHMSGEIERPSNVAHFLAKPFTRAKLRTAVVSALHAAD